MNVKTITAPTIHAALIEARRLLGDDVVLLESVPPEGNQLARITVMAEGGHPGGQAGSQPTARPQRAATARQAAPPEAMASEGRASEGRASDVRAPEAPAPRQLARAFGYGGALAQQAQPARQAAQQAPYPVAAHPEESAPGAEGFSRPGGSYGGDGFGTNRTGPRGAQNGAQHGTRHGAPGGEPPAQGDGYEFSVGARTLLARRGETPPEPRPSARGVAGRNVPGRGNLFPTQADNIRGEALQVAAQQPVEAMENLLQAQLKLLHDRLDQIERRFDGAIIGAAQQWTAHPLFSALLAQGLRPGTATRLFDALAQKGYQPDTAEEALKWAVAQEFRRTLNLATPRQANGAQVFIGPSGTGKTSLVLKLARHPGFYARHKTAIIVVLPEEDDGTFYQSPVELFRRHGLPVTTVRNVDEMRRAILRVQHFDQILIDTPPMPVHEAAARKMLLYVKRLVDPIMPLTVQFVVNATRAVEDFDLGYVQRLPLRPDVLALTHLDETFGWGRIAEWLMTLRMPVQFASTSPRVPDGVLAFSTTWFVEEMMKL